MNETLMIAGRHFQLLGDGQGPVFLMGVFKDEAGEKTVSETKARTAKPFTLVTFDTADWDNDFSPWAAPGMEENRPFGGGGPETLRMLRNEAMPLLKERFGETPVITAGYSLSGLFALWALYECEAFAGAVCCSGSLWVQGFLEYAQKKGLQAGQSVYLSLGGKEEKTTHPIVCTIGDCTRQMDRILKADAVAPRHTLEWNSGGHFADSAKRLAKGLAWMLEK